MITFLEIVKNFVEQKKSRVAKGREAWKKKKLLQNFKLDFKKKISPQVSSWQILTHDILQSLKDFSSNYEKSKKNIMSTYNESRIQEGDTVQKIDNISKYKLSQPQLIRMRSQISNKFERTKKKQLKEIDEIFEKELDMFFKTILKFP